MKKLYCVLGIACFSLSAGAQALVQYGSYSISKDEFLKAYNKNKAVVDDKEKAIREYVELYSNFKLKVKAAEELRLDTLPQIKFDVANFREQIVENYLSNDEGITRLVGEAFDRMQRDKHVYIYSAPLTANASPEDTLKAYKAVNDLYAAVKSGGDGQAVIQAATANKIALRSGDLGYITAFTIPYEYENIVYALKPGEVSKPYRARNGWRFFKMIEERPSVGRWRIAQIMIAVPQDATPEMKIASKQKADELYAKLKSGDNFAELAKNNSNDRTSNLNGGELPEFGTGTYTADFENQVVQLKSDGDISAPFLTGFGYHIIKRLGFRPTPSTKDDEVFMHDLKLKVLNDSRVHAEKELYALQIMRKVEAKKTKDAIEKDLFRYADSIMKNPSDEYLKSTPISNKKILSFKNGYATGADWLLYVRDNKMGTTPGNMDTNKEIWDRFVPYAAVNYYKQHLETYNPDFKFQMQEFKEGNMLFEIMERNVWSKAGNDSIALKNYYQQHAGNYKWAPSADVLIFNATTAKAAEEALTAAKRGTYWKDIAANSNNTLQADSGRYELSQITGANQVAAPTKNSYTAIVTNIDGSATFVKYVNIYPGNMPRSFEDARGLVINDYQQVLEQQWLAQLRKKYPVKVNEAVLKDIMK
jgi:peptidyl-prolyl cis-trans isomerase SurA